MPRDARKESPKRIATKKLPSSHLTGNKTMLCVKEANTRLQKKKEKVEKENKVKKEAVEKHTAAERRSNKKQK